MPQPDAADAQPIEAWRDGFGGLHETPLRAVTRTTVLRRAAVVDDVVLSMRNTVENRDEEIKRWLMQQTSDDLILRLADVIRKNHASIDRLDKPR